MSGWLAAALMWEPLARRLVAGSAGLALWALHSLAWWWLAGVLLALVLALLRGAPGLALLRPWAAGRR